MDLVQKYFRDGTLPTKCMWNMVVLLPKGGGEYRGVGLIEVLQKTVPVVINRHIEANITYHGVLHRFWEGRGAGTASLEAKLIQQLTEIREEVLYGVFLELWKVYDALVQKWCM